MVIRAATEPDLPALMPLLRGYCDFYEANPSDDGLEGMARALIAARQEGRSCSSPPMRTQAS